MTKKIAEKLGWVFEGNRADHSNGYCFTGSLTFIVKEIALHPMHTKTHF